MTEPAESTENSGQEQVTCIARTCLADVAQQVFRPGRDHRGVGYLAVVAGDRRLPARAGKVRDVGPIRNRLSLEHHRLHPDHKAPSEAALRQVAGELVELAADAELDPRPALDLLAEAAVEYDPDAWREGLDDLPDGWRIPDGYEITRAGVYQEQPATADGTEREPVRIAYGPVLPVRILEDPERREVLDLAFLSNDRAGWRVRSVPRSVAKSGKRLVAELGNEGLPIIEADGKHVERWLANAESANRHTIPREPLARWIGWQPDGTFLLPGDESRRLEWRWIEQVNAAQWFRPSGTLVGWQDAIRLLRNDPVVLMVLAGAFTAPLLRPLRLSATVLDIFGVSSRGKTTSARIAQSVWGAPTDHGALGTWGGTLVGWEKRASMAQGVLVVMDDTQQVQEKLHGDLARFLYMVAEGQGKARSGGEHPNLVPIRTFIISTGERPLTSFTTDQGIAPRRIPLARTPFPRTADPDAEARRIDAVMTSLSVNFGQAGPAFVERLTQGLDIDGGLAQLRERHAALTDLTAGETPITARRAPALAALRLAAELASEWGIVPLDPPPIDLWADVFLGPEATENDDIGERALDVLRGEIAARPERFYSPAAVNVFGETRTPHGGWLARALVIEGTPHTLAIKDGVWQLLTARGFRPEAVELNWKDAKIILPQEAGGKRRWTRRTKIGPGATASVDMYVFAPGVLDIGTDDAA